MLSDIERHISRATAVIILLLFSCVSRAQDAPAEEETHHYFFDRTDTLSVNERNLPPELVKKMKEDEAFWYANKDVKQEKQQQQVTVGPEKENGQKAKKNKNETVTNEKETKSSSNPVANSSWFQALLWIVIIGVFCAGLVMYLGNSNIRLFRKKNRMTNANGEMDDTITEDIFAINYQKDIDRAAAQGNYRLAIRLLFLRLLKTMSEKNIIRYKQDKTNLDYLMELHPTNYYNHFFRVTRNYEYSWYGQFPVGEEAYRVIRSEFDQFDKELK